MKTFFTRKKATKLILNMQQFYTQYKHKFAVDFKQ